AVSPQGANQALIRHQRLVDGGSDGIDCTKPPSPQINLGKMTPRVAKFASLPVKDTGEEHVAKSHTAPTFPKTLWYKPDSDSL
ncbi:hypothetical protein JOQ06_014175, partial [Pogonophryne albipinna]